MINPITHLWLYNSDINFIYSVQVLSARAFRAFHYIRRFMPTRVIKLVKWVLFTRAVDNPSYMIEKHYRILHVKKIYQVEMCNVFTFVQNTVLCYDLNVLNQKLFFFLLL